uniref:60S ribosomal protein L26-like n=2 Tax=Hirondellea gigas TaxID=1518452 RepID=A0A2P2HXK7_9CRUS
MKLNKNKTSSSRKMRKRFFQANKNLRRYLMSAPLSKDLRTKYNVRTMPIHKEDEVQVMRGHYKGQQVGKVINVYRKKMAIYIERIQREKANGSTSHIGIHPSNVCIVKLKMTDNRKKLLERRAAGRAAAKGKDKDKFSAVDTASAAPTPAS